MSTTVEAVQPRTFDRAFYGGFWRRFAALTLDSLILLVSLILLAVAAIGIFPQWMRGNWQVQFIAVLMYWLYNTLMQSSSAQATLGQIALKLKVTDLAGRRIGFGRATGRHFASIISVVLILSGYLMNLFTSRRQTLHDVIAGTLVYRSEVDPLLHAAIPPPRGMKVWQVALAVLGCSVPLIGVLGAIAAPAYADFAVRTEMAKAIAAVAPYQTAIEKVVAEGTPWIEINLDTIQPIDPPHSPLIGDFAVEGGVIQMSIHSAEMPKVNGTLLAFVPAQARGGAIAWICGRGSAPDGYIPLLPDSAEFTSTPAKYLPAECR